MHKTTITLHPQYCIDLQSIFGVIDMLALCQTQISDVRPRLILIQYPDFGEGLYPNHSFGLCLFLTSKTPFDKDQPR